MARSKFNFIQLTIEHGVLKFGQFTLKSGRISPYFFNMGLFYQGSALREVGNYYADLWLQHGFGKQQIFGPAYKGITIATVTAVALANHDIDIDVTFNRKEAKDHGEKGILIGAPITGKTVVVDDVISAGTSFRESRKLIHAHGGELTNLIIALDRCERGQTEKSSIEEIRSQGINVYSIITVFDLINYLEHTQQKEHAQSVRDYHKIYGC